MAKLTNYKFWYIKREGGKDDKEFITEAAIRFFEGEMRDVQEKQPDEASGEMRIITVNRYVRERRLQSKELKHLSSLNVKKEVHGDDCIVYDSSHFGEIREEAELCEFLNKELTKDAAREAIESQRMK